MVCVSSSSTRPRRQVKSNEIPVPGGCSESGGTRPHRPDCKETQAAPPGVAGQRIRLEYLEFESKRARTSPCAAGQVAGPAPDQDPNWRALEARAARRSGLQRASLHPTQCSPGQRLIAGLHRPQ
ncbi:unnamed protein product [Arctogadus glacialis]